MAIAGVLTTKRVALGCLCAGALAAGGCADDLAFRHVRAQSASALAASSPRTGDIQVTKECSQNAGLAGQFCTITSSNVDAIEVGARVIYSRARSAGLDSDVILEPPGPGNNRAFGHCTLIAPVCSLGRDGSSTSGGTGILCRWVAWANFSWTGTYSFNPHHDQCRRPSCEGTARAACDGASRRLVNQTSDGAPSLIADRTDTAPL